ncbi:Aste57867_13677 [Aphanomyces stellatus]|uniref:Aste57867_13677 protein n=1 Tax=Aphanomyces stellatus TaxID=120398 RepID=A0A485L0G1_9STRA|nr:hypothetical protein As57867_013627 [Aphanomyces stellatus]VFT90510.1 Aste57867_13677 [Aphanomyces stellatus]
MQSPELPSYDTMPSAAAAQSSASSYTPPVAFAFTINYILGIGCLAIPYAFYQGGLVLGTALLLFITCVCFVTALWIAETLERSQRLLISINNERSPLSRSPNSKRRLLAEAAAAPPPSVTMLCHRYCGLMGASLYQVSLLVLGYGGLIAFSQVFVNSVVSQLPAFDYSDVAAAVGYGLVVIPLSCCDLKEQVGVQVALSIVRFVAVLLMIASASWAVWTHSKDIDAKVETIPLVDFNSFGLLFSAVVLAQLFHHSIPGLLAPLAPADQIHATAVFGTALATTTIFYILLAFSCAYCFGSTLLSSVNLNWVAFTWESHHPFWGRALSFFVVIFPALDTLSIFPLLAVTLADNLAATCHLSSKVLLRLVATVPALIVAVVVKDLAVTLRWCGVFGIYVAFIAPAWLHFEAQRHDPLPTIHSSVLSSNIFVSLVVLFGAVATAIVTMQNMAQDVY